MINKYDEILGGIRTESAEGARNMTRWGERKTKPSGSTRTR